MKKPTSILFPGAMFAAGLIYEYMALKMPRGSLAQPGPGFYPMAVGVFLTITALGCLLQELRNPDTPRHAASSPDEAAPGERRFGKTVQLTALMIGYILVLKPLGYPVAIALFLLAAIRIFGSRNWISAGIIAGIITAISYFVFILWLKVPLPLGILDEILG